MPHGVTHYRRRHEGQKISSGRAYPVFMTMSKSSKQTPAARMKGRRVRMTIAELFTLSDEERIRRMYDMTPEEAQDVMRDAGLLTPSGRLKRCYR